MVYGTLEDPETTTATTGTAWLRNLTAPGEMSGSGGFGVGVGVGVGVAGGPSLAAAQQGQGVAALLVMLAVLCFIFAYCCWGAPFCRSLCRRHCCCRLEDPEPDSRFGNSDQAMVATPTIILLPHGRMLVVDGTIFTQFQTDTTGLDLVELGDSVIRAQRNPRSINRHQLQSSQGSILEMDAETPSKDSLGSMGCFPPPTYESIYGKEESDMPPSYSDILLHRFANLPHEIDMHNFCHDDKEEIEMQAMESCSRILSNPMNTFPYAYAAVTSFSSQSFPRRAVSRDPSIISNPLDNYYVDDEMEMYQTRAVYHESNSDRHREMTNFRFVGGQTNEQASQVSRNDERRGSIRSEDGLARSRARSASWISREEIRKNQENVRRGSDWGTTSGSGSGPGPAHSPSRSNAMDRDRGGEAPGPSEGQESNAPESAASRVYASGGSVISVAQNDTNGNVAEARHSSSIDVDEPAGQLERARTSDSLMYSDDDAAATRNFGALADIRESRV